MYGGTPLPPKMSQVDDSRIVTDKVFKRLTLTPNLSIWRALAEVRTGRNCQSFWVAGCRSARARESPEVVKEHVRLGPEMRLSLETGAVLEGAWSRYVRSDCGACL